MKIPHRVVDDVINGFANGAKGFVGGTAGAVKGAGKSIMGALDKGFTQVTGKVGPHRIIDRVADGIIDAGVNFTNQGLIGSAQIAGEAVMKALDQPVEQVKGLSEMKLPFGGG